MQLSRSLGHPGDRNEADLVARYFDLRLQRTVGNNLHHRLGGLGGEARGRWLEIKHHTIYRRLQLLVAQGDPA